MDKDLEKEKEKDLNELKAAFLFNVSHDIRTPMNAIMGFTALARRHMDQPELLEEYLDKVEVSSRYLLALIDDLLEMSKLDYGQIEIKSDPCSLSEQVGAVVDMFRAQAEDKQVKIETTMDFSETQVFLDALRFRRILGNLLSNAVKFTPEHGSVRVSVHRKKVSSSGFARYEISVEDTGIGMTEDFMARMYEAFEREESSTKTGSIGTGLGLAITKRLLDMMGGSISVRSEKGKGSKFTVELPLKLSGNVWEEQAAVPAKQEVPKALGRHRILLVEDIDVNRILAETILKEAGFLVESVSDGCDAVEAIRNHPPKYYDLVLMDIQMPVMNGYEATRSIRALQREDVKDLPIIALSANAREQDKAMSMESGMNFHLAKPFDIANLVSTINGYIKGVNRKEL